MSREKKSLTDREMNAYLVCSNKPLYLSALKTRAEGLKNRILSQQQELCAINKVLKLIETESQPNKIK